MESSNIDLQDIISSESYTYSVSNIEDKRLTYTAGNTVQIGFPPGNYVMDCRQVHLIFDSVVDSGNAVAGAYYPRQPEDFFGVNNLEINGVQLMQSTMSQGKNLFTNWLQNSLTPYKPEQQMLPLSSLSASSTIASVNNYTGAEGSILSYEPIHLVYKGLAAANINASHMLAYNMAQLSASKYRQKQYNISLDTGTGIISSAAPTLANEFSVNQIRLGSICPEFDSLGMVNMCNTSIRIQLRFNDNNRVLTTGAHGAKLAATTYLVLGTEAYSLSNLCLYYKVMQIKPNLIAQAKMLMNKPRPILTIYQNIKTLEGVVTNQRISVNTSNLYYPNANSKTDAKAAPLQINYSAVNSTAGDSANFLENFNNLRYGTYEDSLEFKYNQLVCDIGGKQFKSSIINVGNRDLKAWIDAQNAVYQCTGQYLNISLNQYLNNRYFAIIPLSPNQFPDTVYQDNLASSDKRYSAPTNMQMVTFVVGSKLLLDGATRLE